MHALEDDALGELSEELEEVLHLRRERNGFYFRQPFIRFFILFIK